MTYDSERFIKNLRDLMDSRGQSLREAASAIGISAPTLSRYLSAQRTPDIVIATQIADYYSVPIAWLIGLADSRYDAIPEEIKEMVSLYQLASAQDRDVINLILSKYKNQEG